METKKLNITRKLNEGNATGVLCAVNGYACKFLSVSKNKNMNKGINKSRSESVVGEDGFAGGFFKLIISNPHPSFRTIASTTGMVGGTSFPPDFPILAVKSDLDLEIRDNRTELDSFGLGTGFGLANVDVE